MSTTLAPPTVPEPRRQLAWAVAARAALTDPVTVHDLLATRDVEDTAADLISGVVGGFPSNPAGPGHRGPQPRAPVQRSVADS